MAPSVRVDGRKIEHLRKTRASLTRKQMATALGISEPALYYIERSTQRTSPQTLKRIAALFGVAPEDLSGGLEDESAAPLPRAAGQ